MAKRLDQAVGVATELHTDAAAARRALQHDRIAEGLCLPEGVVRVRQQTGPGEQRQPALCGQPPGGVLQAEVADLLRRGTDESDAAGLAGLRKSAFSLRNP